MLEMWTREVGNKREGDGEGGVEGVEGGRVLPISVC